ncbi:DUF7619 domain-containing protein [Pontibacter diazotrophicus]|uniref:DUF7619 domain-containing protein n=1 Tax=Pontibacter diazotrophicus TaxID=1400979 RepID=UPI001FE52597|nr:IPT/TIG domain-containing protein [Pontibacter diazotrophicus]
MISFSDATATVERPTYRDLAVDATGNIFVLSKAYHTDYFSAKRTVKKYSPVGELLMEYNLRDSIMPRPQPNDPKSIAIDASGNLYVAGQSVDIFDTAANLTGSLPVISDLVAVSATGECVVTNTFQKYNNILILGKSNANSKKYITGTVFNDVNQNQKMEGNEAKLKNMIIKSLPEHIYGMTDMYGNYSLAVDAVGTHEVSQILPENLGMKLTQTFPSQSSSHSVEVTQDINDVTNINFGNHVTLSPYLSVSVSSTRRRRCFESTTKLTYSNTGFAPAENAKVFLQLPEQVELISADRPFTRLPNGTYVFEAGTVAPGQSGVITIQDEVICGDESIRGLTVCTKAWITPGNQIPTAPPTAVSTITGKCDANTGYVWFVIRNNGQVDMETGEQFRVYQDGKLATVENYTLAAGDSMVLRVPAMGRTIRLEADQPNGNGDNTLASATVEGCGTGGSPAAAFSTGFVNAMPTDDEEAEVAEECLPISDSFDPNDKLVTPQGLTEENLTPTGTALKYKIRFQNTGTDVAYRVVVVDTLSEYLDLSTLQIGSASHGYTYEVSGKGRPVITWTFQNIMLPDSTSDEPGSHGYIQFSIKPKADLPEKTVVENFADIFFDFNSPVRTNVTVNRIYDMPLEMREENRIVADEVIMTPTIAGFTPAAGRFGAEVSITGSKFSENKSSNKVYVNGVQAEVLEGDATTLKVRVPVGASTGTLSVVTEHAGASSKAAFVVYQPPVVSGFSPAEGVVGAEVTLQGNYLSSELVERVQLGSRDCEIIRVNQNTVRIRIPADAATDTFTVHTKGGTVQSEAAYRVWYAPAITGFDKPLQRVGGRLLLQGENFATEPNRNSVLFGNIQAEVLQATAQTLEVRVPAGAQSGTVSLTTPGGTASRAFEVIPAPVITAVYPAKGSVGTLVELQGERFLTLGKRDTVSFGGVEAIVLNASGTALQVRVPRGAMTGKVRVAGVGGSDEADFEVEQLTPSQAIAVFPNPSTGRFTVDFTRADFNVQAVQVFDTTGRLLFSEALNAGQPERVEVDLSGEKAGVFLVMVQTERGKVVKKITLL